MDEFKTDDVFGGAFKPGPLTPKRPASIRAGHNVEERRKASLDDSHDTEEYVVATRARTGVTPDWSAAHRAIAILNGRERNGAFK